MVSLQMVEAVAAIALLGSALGALLGVAARHLAMPADERAEAIVALLPGSNCGQCGFAGCKPAAAAMVEGRAPPTCCPPGGASTAARLGQLLGVRVDAGAHQAAARVAVVEEAKCIGCTRCIKKCSSDAIVGAVKQMHTVLPEACYACELCVAECPADAIRMRVVAPTLATWHWPRPGAAVPAVVRHPAVAG